MIGGYLTPRRFRGALFLGALLVLIVAVGAFLFWRWTTALPQARAGSFLAKSPALELPSRPEGVVVLARPGGWARFFARNPSRAVLLDPSWWQSLETRSTGRRSSEAPGAGTALLLDQFRHGLAVAWWRDGWIVQGAVPGGGAARRLGALLPQHLAGKWRLENGVLRIASAPTLLEGSSWTVRPSVDPSRRLACWAWIDGAQWPGWWENGELVLERGRMATISLPGSRGALLAHVEDGRRVLDLVGDRIPSRGLLEGIRRQLNGLLSRPIGLWLRRLEVGPALPRPLVALELDLLEGEDGRKVAESLRDLLCPFGCASGNAMLSDGRQAMHWESAIGSWWVVVVPGDAVIGATSRGQLETFLGARTAWPGGDWALVDGDAAAGSLRTLASARLLAVFGLIRNGQLNRMRHLAVPLRGLKTLRWRSDPNGARIELQPAPAE